MKITIPKYQQIAADVASKIVQGHYEEGQKIYVRSSLASQYGVSSETARRAICILSDMDIVELTKGSGVRILSMNKAEEFLKNFNSTNQINDLQAQIMPLIEAQIQNSVEVKNLITELMYKTERFRHINPFHPFKIEITNQSNYIGVSLSDSNFWHNTLATVIAIKRNEKIIISPGPYAVLTEGDMLYYVGDEDCCDRVRIFLYEKENL